MNTHLLIPIKDIETLIEDTKLPGESMFEQGMRHAYQGLLYHGKQISLDEIELEEKAELFDSTHKANQKYGYKQALKDLKIKT